MKRILTLFSILSFAACAPKGTTTELTIGTYGGHLYRYSFDSQTLEFTLKGAAEARNASYALTYGDNIFAVSEAGAGSGAYSFRETEGTGIGMTADLRQTGADPCFLMVRKDRNGSDYMMTADYSGGSVSVFPIHDGRLEDLTEQLRFEGSGPVTERQEASHIHQLKAVPGAEGYILASDLGADAIRVIRAREGGKLEHVKDIRCPEGSGPRHMEFNAKGSMMYYSRTFGRSAVVQGHICGRCPGIHPPAAYPGRRGQCRRQRGHPHASFGEMALHVTSS